MDSRNRASDTAMTPLPDRRRSSRLLAWQRALLDHSRQPGGIGIEDVMNASRSPAEHATALLDLLVTVAMGIAAVLLIWRTLGAPTSSRERLSPAVEEVASAELVTTIEGAPTLGSLSAPVVLIEYSDFECPYCARHAAESFEWIERDFVTKGQVQYVFRNFPIETLHPSAVTAARLAHCADRQNKFWEMRRHLFATQGQGRLEDANRVEIASNLGLSPDRFQECVSRESMFKVESDKAEGVRLGVSSTPTFLVGRRVSRDSVRLLQRLRGAARYSLFRDLLTRAVADNARGKAGKP